VISSSTVPQEMAGSAAGHAGNSVLGNTVIAKSRSKARLM